MSIQQTRTCRKCRSEISKDAKFCTQCGVDLTPFSRHAFVITLGLTAVPLVITPILLLSSIDPVEAGLAFGIPYVLAFLFITFLMVVYSAVGGVIEAIVRRKNRSAARGVLIGLAVGLLLGVGSCTASFAVIS